MNEDNIRTLKTFNCPTVTGKSQLGYALGKDESGEIHFRITRNNGGGFFSNEWVAWTDILQALEKKPDEITSILLFPLFRGKSANTPAFLLAALKHEKLVVLLKGRNRKYQLADPKAFLAKVEQLASGKKTPATKKKVTRRRKPAA